MNNDPQPQTVIPDALSGVLRDVVRRLDHWEHHDGLDNIQPDTSEHSRILARRMCVLDVVLEHNLPPYSALVAIAADAIRWAAETEAGQ